MQIYREAMESTVDSILYIETDIPPRMTFADYRRERARRNSRKSFVGRLRARRAHKSR
jgi:hypothetical protein